MVGVESHEKQKKADSERSFPILNHSKVFIHVMAVIMASGVHG